MDGEGRIGYGQRSVWCTWVVTYAYVCVLYTPSLLNIQMAGGREHHLRASARRGWNNLGTLKSIVEWPCESWADKMLEIKYASYTLFRSSDNNVRLVFFGASLCSTNILPRNQSLWHSNISHIKCSSFSMINIRWKYSTNWFKLQRDQKLDGICLMLARKC